jgi:hypothetical protein
MAKKARPRKRRVTFAQAKTVLARAGVPQKEFGRFTADGKSVVINQRVLDALSKSSMKKRKTVRFVALNAPFKRRSPIAPV